MRVNVARVLKNGGMQWRVRWQDAAGKDCRRFFGSKALADAEALSVKQQTERAGSVWLALTAAQRNEIADLLTKCERGGFTLRQAVERYPAVSVTSVTLGAAYERFMLAKGRERLAKRTMAKFKSNVGRFVKGREASSLALISRESAAEWLGRDGWGPRTFNTVRGSLSAFFNWCVVEGLLEKSPVSKIAAIKERRMADLDDAPVILNIAQVKALLGAALQSDPGLALYVALGLFAGLRPEREAARLGPGDINGEILVRGLHAKDRQRRMVPIQPALAAWLALPYGDFGTGGTYRGGRFGPGLVPNVLGPCVEFGPCNLRKRFERVRELAGLIRVRKTETGQKITNTGWAQDCLRHTFASYALATFGPAWTIAALGHGDYDMLFGHYRALVRPEDAAVFWGLTPATVLAP